MRRQSSSKILFSTTNRQLYQPRSLALTTSLDIWNSSWRYRSRGTGSLAPAFGLGFAFPPAAPAFGLGLVFAVSCLDLVVGRACLASSRLTRPPSPSPDSESGKRALITRAA